MTPNFDHVFGIQNVHFRQEREVIADKDDEDIVALGADEAG
jgi:hypothetical protein